MYGTSLLVLARLVGLRQVDIAAHLGIVRNSVNQWRQGLRPIPKTQRGPLIAHIAAAVARYLRTGQTDMVIPAGVPEPQDPQRLPTQADLTALLRTVFAENCYRYGHTTAPTLEAVMAGLERYEALMHPQRLLRPNMEEGRKRAAAVAFWFEMQGTLAPLLALLPDDEPPSEEELPNGSDNETGDDARPTRRVSRADGTRVTALDAEQP